MQPSRLVSRLALHEQLSERSEHSHRKVPRMHPQIGQQPFCKRHFSVPHSCSRSCGCSLVLRQSPKKGISRDTGRPATPVAQPRGLLTDFFRRLHDFRQFSVFCFCSIVQDAADLRASRDHKDAQRLVGNRPRLERCICEARAFEALSPADFRTWLTITEIRR